MENLQYSFPANIWRKYHSVFWNAVLITLLFSFMVVAMSLFSRTYSDFGLPKINNGVLDVSNSKILESKSLPLVGTWSFFWNQLLTPDQPGNEKIFYSVPGTWESREQQGEAYPSYGHATFRASIKLNQLPEQLALQIPAIGTAFQLYVDETLLASAGVVADNPNSAKPGYHPQLLLFRPASREFELTLQVSNYDLFWGGMWQSIRLGEANVLISEQSTENFRSSFFVAVFVTVMVMNLMQFSLRPSDLAPIMVALSCLLLGTRELESGNVLQFANMLQLSFETSVRINFLTFVLVMPVMGIYLHMNFPEKIRTSVMVPLYVLSTLYGLLIIVSDPSFSSQFMQYFQILSIAYMPYVLYCLARAAIAKLKGAKLLFTGTLLICAFGANDILVGMGQLDSQAITSYGFVCFVFCQNYVTFARFVEAKKRLQVLSNTLEQKVEQRTQELELSNRKLEEKANRDELTGLPNRRGIKPHLDDAVSELNNKHVPSCLLILDFDHFKIINDTLGHDIGDKVLEEGGQLITDILRRRDIAARWGGEEFLVLLPDTPLQGGMILAEKLRENIHSKLTASIGSDVSTTIGIVELCEGESIESSLKRADEALYEGKNSGRNKVVSASVDPQGLTL